MRDVTDEQAEAIILLLGDSLGKALPDFEKALGTKLDVASVVIGVLMSVMQRKGKQSDTMVEFLSQGKNKEILFTLREEMEKNVQE